MKRLGMVLVATLVALLIVGAGALLAGRRRGVAK